MMEKKAIIIGAGMAGLSTGVHLQKNGYDTLILEAHSQPGGLVAAWRRGRYLFDGCLHWLPGCNRQSGFYEVNDELFGMAKLDLVRHETIMDVECLDNIDPNGDRFFHMYADIDRLQAYMKAMSPADAGVIDWFAKLARVYAKYKFPPNLKPPQLMTLSDKLGMVRYLPLLIGMKRIAKYSVKDFAARFQHPFLREAFTRVCLGQDYPISIIAVQVAFGHQQSSAYVLGGSATLVRAAEAKYLACGGELRCGTRVATIRVAEGKARGVKLQDGTEIAADIVVSAADGRWTLFTALEGRYLSPDLRDLYAEKKLAVFDANVYVSLGLKRRLDGLSHQLVFVFDEPLTLCDGSRHCYLAAHIVNYDPGFAPNGCTVINVMLSTKADQFWVDLRDRDRQAYLRAKEQAKDFVVDVLERKIGGIREHIEEWDVATPATFIRYTGNWRGSIQGWMPGKDFPAAKPPRRELPGLRDFYMVGQWTEPGGGITPAIKTGRDIAWMICVRDGKRFKV